MCSLPIVLLLRQLAFLFFLPLLALLWRACHVVAIIISGSSSDESEVERYLQESRSLSVTLNFYGPSVVVALGMNMINDRKWKEEIILDSFLAINGMRREVLVSRLPKADAAIM